MPDAGWHKTEVAWAWLYHLLRWGLAGVFIYAGALKLADPGGFAEIVARYGLVPQALVPWVALGLPALEVLAGLGLILEFRGSLSSITAMLLIFALVLWFGVLRDLDIDCGCFSRNEVAEHHGLRQALYRDLIMLAGAAYLYWWRWRGRARRGPGGWRLRFDPLETKVKS